jgi:hypothetical protein
MHDQAPRAWTAAQVPVLSTRADGREGCGSRAERRIFYVPEHAIGHASCRLPAVRLWGRWRECPFGWSGRGVIPG